MMSLLDVDAALPEESQEFWKDILARCTERPTEVLEGTETSYPETVEAYVRQDGVTRFCCDLEITLFCGYSQEEYAEDFRRALHLLTKDVVPDFKVSLSLYYLEHDADLSVEYDRLDLAA
jgi:hypothetical protein